MEEIGQLLHISFDVKEKQSRIDKTQSLISLQVHIIFDMIEAKNMKLDERLYQLRKKKGLTQAAVAEKLGVSRQAVSRWEIGAAVPTLENIKVLSELFGVRVEYLLPGDSSVEENEVAEKNKEEQSEKLLISQKGDGKSPMAFDLKSPEYKQFEKIRTGKLPGLKRWIVIGCLTLLLIIAGIIYLASSYTKGKTDTNEVWLSEWEYDENESSLGTDFQFS